jgi:hypothetical protein
VAAILAAELDKDKGWEEQQLHDFTKIAQSYIL